MTNDIPSKAFVKGIHSAFVPDNSGRDADQQISDLSLSRSILSLLGAGALCPADIFDSRTTQMTDLELWPVQGLSDMLMGLDESEKMEVLGPFADVDHLNGFCKYIQKKEWGGDANYKNYFINWDEEFSGAAPSAKRRIFQARGARILYEQLLHNLVTAKEGFQTLIFAAPLTTRSRGGHPSGETWHILERVFNDGITCEEALSITMGLQLLNQNRNSVSLREFIEKSKLQDYFSITDPLLAQDSDDPDGLTIIQKVSNEADKNDNFAIKLSQDIASFAFLEGEQSSVIFTKDKYLRIRAGRLPSAYKCKSLYKGTHMYEDLCNLCVQMAVIMCHTNGIIYTLRVPSNLVDPESTSTLIYTPRYWSNFITSTYNLERKKQTSEYKPDQVEVTDWMAAQKEALDPSSLLPLYYYDIPVFPENKNIILLKEYLAKPLPESQLSLYYGNIKIDLLEAPVKIDLSIHLVITINVDTGLEISELIIETDKDQSSEVIWEGIFNNIRRRGLTSVNHIVCNGVYDQPAVIGDLYPDALKVSLIHKGDSIFKDFHYSRTKAIMDDMNRIYSAICPQRAMEQVEIFTEKWSAHPTILEYFTTIWPDVMKRISYPEEKRLELDKALQDFEDILEHIQTSIANKVKKIRANVRKNNISSLEKSLSFEDELTLTVFKSIQSYKKQR